MTKFKVGDKVIRIAGSHNGMKVGDEAIVTSVTPNGEDIKFSTFSGPGYHDGRKFTRVPKETLQVPLKEGDKVICVKEMPGIPKGSIHTITGFSPEGNLLLQSHSGEFTRERWNFHKRPSDSCRKDRNEGKLDTYSEGDTVMLLDYGWGIGECCGTKLGVPLKVLSDSDSNRTMVKRADGASANVNNCALRLIKRKNEKTKEQPMAFKKKESKGTVSDYKGLSTPRTIIEQQSHANKVLRDFTRKHTGRVVVCGGAPRNWDHGKQANDIDVYFYLSTDNAVMAHANLATRLGISTSDIKRLGEGNPYKYTGNNIKFVFDVTLAGQQYQFIVVCNPITDVKKDVLDYFNCDLCKISWDPVEDSFARTPEYKTDKEYKRLTYRMYMLEESNARMSMEKHVPKMMNQFPDHTVMIIQKDPYGPQQESQDDPFRI